MDPSPAQLVPMESSPAQWFSAIGTLAAVFYTLSHAAVRRWWRIPKFDPSITTHFVEDHKGRSLVVSLVVLNSGRAGAEKVTVTIRKIKFTPGSGQTGQAPEHKRSLLVWENTDSEKSIPIPLDVSEQVTIFTVPCKSDQESEKGSETTEANGSVIGTGGPSTDKLVFVGTTHCEQKPGTWDVWVLLSAELRSSQQFKITIQYNGTKPDGKTLESRIEDIIPSSVLEEIKRANKKTPKGAVK
jgi:hypothetical protein